MKTIIAGSRSISDYSLLKEAITDSGFNISEIVSGGARGVDELGERYGKEEAIPVYIMPADWDTHGKAAGPYRNEEMASYADALIALWDGESSGTKNMVEAASRHDLDIYLARTDGEPDWLSYEVAQSS